MRTVKSILILLLAITLLISGCVDKDTEPAPDALVGTGDTVTLDYTLRYSNDTVIETSIEAIGEENDIDQIAESLVFEVGSGQMFPVVDEGLIGMGESDNERFTLPPEEGFGVYNEELVQSIPVQEYMNATNATELPEPGERMMSQIGPISVKDVNETHITLDANSPLAGKTLIFDVTVVSINKTEELTNNSEV